MVDSAVAASTLILSFKADRQGAMVPIGCPVLYKLVIPLTQTITKPEI